MHRRVILLVEDDPSDIGLTRRAFEKSRITNELIVIEDGQQALDYLLGVDPKSGQGLNPLPAVVLLDLKLPKVDGLEVLRRISQMSGHRLPSSKSKKSQDMGYP